MPGVGAGADIDVDTGVDTDFVARSLQGLVRIHGGFPGECLGGSWDTYNAALLG